MRELLSLYLKFYNELFYLILYYTIILFILSTLTFLSLLLNLLILVLLIIGRLYLFFNQRILIFFHNFVIISLPLNVLSLVKFSLIDKCTYFFDSIVDDHCILHNGIWIIACYSFIFILWNYILNLIAIRIFWRLNKFFRYFWVNIWILNCILKLSCYTIWWKQLSDIFQCRTHIFIIAHQILVVTTIISDWCQ